MGVVLGALADARRAGRIRHLGLSGFFLLHHDMLELAREVALEVRDAGSTRRLLPPGRGRGCDGPAGYAMNMRAADAIVSSAPKAMNILPISEVWSQVEVSSATAGFA